jgi:hypothetical protein
MAKKKFAFKDPDEDLDYLLNWADRIGDGDPIVTSVWTIVTTQTDSPDVILSKHDESITAGEITDADVGTIGSVVANGATLLWLEGGVLGTTYELLNRITTAGARIMDQTVYIQIKKK